MCRVDVYKRRRRREVLLRQRCRVGPDASLRVPDLEAVEMKSRQAPVLIAKKTHWVVGRDRCAAAVAHVPEARAAPPQLDRVRSWEQTEFDPMSNEFPKRHQNHNGSVTYLRYPLNAPLVQGLNSVIATEYAIGVERLG